jgi:hypothetical protein
MRCGRATAQRKFHSFAQGYGLATRSLPQPRSYSAYKNDRAAKSHETTAGTCSHQIHPSKQY